MKRCSRCGEAKAPDAFTRERKQRDGRCRICRSCRAAVRRGESPPGQGMTTARARAEMLWQALSPEGRARVTLQFERHSPGDSDALFSLGGLDDAA